MAAPITFAQTSSFTARARAGGRWPKCGTALALVPLRMTSTPFALRTLSVMLLMLPLGCDAEPEPEPDDLRVEPDDETLDEPQDDAVDRGLDASAADQLAAPLDPAAVSPGFSIEIEIVGDDVVLTWPQIQDAVQYGVYRSVGPYFTPPPYGTYGSWWWVGGTWGNTGPHQLVHEGAAATAETYYYRVVAWNAQTYVRGFSATAVKLAQPLVGGANLVSQPLLDSTVDDAESLHEALGGFAGPVGQVSRWNAPMQSFEDWQPWSGEPGFDIEPGEAVFVHTFGPGLLVTVGLAPAANGDIVHQMPPGWNLVTVPMDVLPPFDWATIDASQVASLLGYGAQQLAEWDPATQSFVSYVHPQGWGTDFDVEITQPLWVQTNSLTVWD